MQNLSSRKPYLIRAINEWILDNQLTPYLSVAAEMEEVVVPPEFIQDGEIILNIDPQSVRNLEIGDEYIMFDARFSGRPYAIVVPITAVQAVYAKENGEGMLFVADAELAESDEPDDDGPDDPTPPQGRPQLKVVK